MVPEQSGVLQGNPWAIGPGGFGVAVARTFTAYQKATASQRARAARAPTRRSRVRGRRRAEATAEHADRAATWSAGASNPERVTG